MCAASVSEYVLVIYIIWFQWEQRCWSLCKFFTSQHIQTFIFIIKGCFSEYTRNNRVIPLCVSFNQCRHWEDCITSKTFLMISKPVMVLVVPLVLKNYLVIILAVLALETQCVHSFISITTHWHFCVRIMQWL